MTSDWTTDSKWEFLSDLAAWFFWSVVQAGLGWLEAGFGKLPVSGLEAIAMAVVIAVSLLWVIIRLIKMLAFLGSLVVIGALGVRFLAF